MPDIFVATDKQTENPATTVSKTLGHEENSHLENLDDNNFHQKRMHLFSAFYKNPQGINFKNQEKDEKILLFIRKAVITNFKWVFVSIIFLLLPLLAFLFVNFGGQIISFPTKYILFFLAFYI